MSQHRVAVTDGAEEQPSHKAIDNGNPTKFRPRYLVLDDINVDLISAIAMAAAAVSYLLFHCSGVKALLLVAALILPLRIFFPRPTIPTGLVLITGASSGIGAELSYIFAERGHDLVLVGRNEDQLGVVKAAVEQKIGTTAHTITCDLSIIGATKQLYDRVKQQGLNVEVLVNGAGLGGAGDTLDQPIEFAERMTVLNCIALVQLTQLFGKDMVERGRGWMLQISSVGGWMASPHQNIYHATKHYVRAFSESLSLELRGYPGIVNTQLMPGPTHTQFITRAHAEEVFMMAASGAVEDPKAVARAGYEGLRKGKRMVFSSWNAAATALMMELMPRIVHLTFASFMNAPLQGWARANDPTKDQRERAEEL